MLSPSQKQGRERHLAYQREVMEQFIKLLKEAEAVASNSACIDGEGLALYSIRNTVQLKLEALPAE